MYIVGRLHARRARNLVCNDKAVADLAKLPFRRDIRPHSLPMGAEHLPIPSPSFASSRVPARWSFHRPRPTSITTQPLKLAHAPLVPRWWRRGESILSHCLSRQPRLASYLPTSRTGCGVVEFTKAPGVSDEKRTRIPRGCLRTDSQYGAMFAGMRHRLLLHPPNGKEST